MSNTSENENIRLLTFSCGDEEYAIDISIVTNIIEIPEITFVPMLPDYIKGLINLRGKAIPVIDTALRFYGECDEYDRHSCIIVYEIKGSSLGLIVQSVGDVIDVSNSCISGTPGKKGFVSAVVNTGDGLYKLIRPEEIAED